MRKVVYASLALFSALLLTAGNAAATSYGDNITIYDGTQDAAHTGTGQGREDNETEPGMVNTQAWDLEGFFLKSNTLSMIGGYNFKDGYGGFTSGDVFISTTGSYGNTDPNFSDTKNNVKVKNTFGYEYAIDLDFTSSTYNVYALNANSWTITAYYPENENDSPGSNPWRYASGGDLISQGNSFSFVSGLTNGQTSFTGGTHYAVTGLDLSFLGANTNFVAHFTMGCGNDNLMGSGTTAPVPEPATMMLFGTGLAGLAGAYRRKRRNA
ncbi:MAG: PEP-CTERM sorting domain-containing protein [Pseudomonadota bacterium]